MRAEAWRSAVVLALVLGAAACAGARRPAAPLLPRSLEMREYVIPWENAYPGDLAVDTAGRVWFTERMLNGIGMLDPATGEFRMMMPPTERSGPYGMVAAPDGGIWVALSRIGGVLRLDPATGAMREYAMEGATGGPHLLAWREGVLWFGLRDSRGYGRLDPATGASELFRLERDRPYSLTAGPGGVWMSSFETFRLIEVDAATGSARIHDLAPVPVTPFGGAEIVRDRAHQRWPGEVRRVVGDETGIWFTDFARSRVVRYDVALATLTSYDSLERDAQAYGLARSRTGAIWYGERGGNRVTVLDPLTGERRRVAVPTPGAHARTIVLDERRGRAWVPLSETGRLGLIEYR